MNKARFVGIGRLGGRDSEGFHHVMIKPEHKTVFSGLDSVFLVFNSDRVFYVTIGERKKSDNKLWVRFVEDGIAAEQPKHREVIIALEQDEVPEEIPEMDILIGYGVILGDTVLGQIEDYFFNGAQDVLQIRDNDGCEILLPFVPHYIQAVLHPQKSVIIQNAGELVALYRGEAKGDEA